MPVGTHLALNNHDSAKSRYARRPLEACVPSPCCVCYCCRCCAMHTCELVNMLKPCSMQMQLALSTHFNDCLLPALAYVLKLFLTCSYTTSTTSIMILSSKFHSNRHVLSMKALKQSRPYVICRVIHWLSKSC
jgi:hypothetical protein